MNRKYLNMHIDQATPKKISKREKIILTIESIAIVMLFIFFIFLFLISDIIENYFLGVLQWDYIFTFIKITCEIVQTMAFLQKI